MHMLRSTLLVLMLCTGTAALAETRPLPLSESRERRQELRIERGTLRGDIAPGEARQLQRGQGRVDRLQAAARADGHVGIHERARLQRVQDRQQRRIRRAVAY